mgnify:CR=1 FL=1
MKKTIVTLGALSFVAANASAAIFINEIHYDNTGADTGEFIEVVTTGGETAADVTVSLYNGSDGELYGSNDTFNLAADFTDHGVLGDGNHYYSLLPSSMQNGGPDGISIDLLGVVAEFISYEGVIGSAGDGPAIGLASTDIGIAETSGTAVGSSLQRTAFGSTWEFTDGTNTQGAINAAVPEPSSTALLGLAGLATLLRRKR